MSLEAGFVGDETMGLSHIVESPPVAEESRSRVAMGVGRMKIAFSMILVLMFLFQGVLPFDAGAGQAYRLGPGDVLLISIFAGGTVQESVEVAVSSQGDIEFPFLGPVRAEGRTVSELAEAVTGPLERDYFVRPQVLIKVKEYRSFKVYVAGAVDRPGLYVLEEPNTILEILAKAGGVTEHGGNRVLILKGSVEAVSGEADVEQLARDGKTVSLDLKSVMARDGAGKNVFLESGDVVYVPPKTSSEPGRFKISVLGQVKKPGLYDFQEGMTLIDVCTMAGGFGEFAAVNRVLITRKSSGGTQESIEVNAKNVIHGEEKDPVLQPGDRVYVPESWF